MDTIKEKSIELDGEVFADRRATVRRRVLKGATLSFNNGYGALEGVVRNESEQGALLHFGETSAVPSRFDLVVKGSMTRAARVRWRDTARVGVEFIAN
ncbi:hypothetical protein ASD64_10620 [Mesorhizobium sp. Root157]|uniref:PilZ domain-containing protein n=1 Tax=Mesorhizobium sp. Root157 TaxID=1736477 RepID=UPI0006F4597F|nr:PilZ domain-containing protein [Mesorhizobium sp. Root157]KQZ81429.1 hypothetical protein ASD64_10620 [Mesorhizobium sp. Root157]